MAWVEFLAPYIFTPARRRQSSVVYKEGGRYSVTAECARKAVKAGAALRIPTPRRPPVEAS